MQSPLPLEIKADYCSNTKLKTFIGNTAVMHLITVQNSVSYGLQLRTILCYLVSILMLNM